MIRISRLSNLERHADRIFLNVSFVLRGGCIEELLVYLLRRFIYTHTHQSVYFVRRVFVTAPCITNRRIFSVVK